MSGRIQSVLINTFCTLFGQAPADRFVDIFDQVAYLAEHMAKDHIFEDGNKRTSLVLAFSVLRTQNVAAPLFDEPDPRLNSYYLWIQDLVSGARSREELAGELRRSFLNGRE